MFHAKKSTHERERLHIIMNKNKELQKKINYLEIENKNIKEMFYANKQKIDVKRLNKTLYVNFIPMLHNSFLSLADPSLTMQEHTESLSSKSKNLSKIDISFSDNIATKQSNKEFFLVLSKFPFQR